MIAQLLNALARRHAPLCAIFVGVGFTLGLAGCPAPIDLNIQLWVPPEENVVENVVGFDLSVVVAGGTGAPVRLNRGEVEGGTVEGLSVPEGGLEVETVILEAIGNNGRIASGRTGAATLFPDGTSTPTALTAILAPEGISELIAERPQGRNDSAVCSGGNGRAYVIGGTETNNGAILLDESVRIDPSARDAVEIGGPPPQRDGACAARTTTDPATADDEILWVVGGCDQNATALGLSRSEDQGETFDVIDAAPLACLTSASVFGDRLWILAGNVVQVRDAEDGTLIGEAAVSPPRFGGAIVAINGGAVIGGGLDDDGDDPTFTSVALDFVTESEGTLAFAPFGPPDVEKASFAIRADDGEIFALLSTATTTQIHRLQPAISSAPVQVEAAPLAAGGFDPEHLIIAPSNTFFVLNESESIAREFNNNDGSTTDFAANAFGARMINDVAGAVYLLGGAAQGVKTYVQQIQ